MNKETIDNLIDSYINNQLPNGTLQGSNLLIENMQQQTSTHKVQTVIRKLADLTKTITANSLNLEDDIVDNLLSTMTNKALSANQGFVLKTKIDNIENIYGQPNGLATLDSNGKIQNSNLPIATEIIQGISRFSTQTESNSLTSSTTFLSPARLPIGTVNQLGLTQFASPIETVAGILETKSVTPKGLTDVIANLAQISHSHTVNDITDFATEVIALLPDGITIVTQPPINQNAIIAIDPNSSIDSATGSAYGFASASDFSNLLNNVSLLSTKIDQIEAALRANNILA